jgi:hypothetical protein
MLFVPDRMARFIFCMHWRSGTEKKESNVERSGKQRNPKQSPHHDDLTLGKEEPKYLFSI